MSNEKKDPTKKHRHDIGEVAHGPASTESVTRNIQVLLAIGMVLTAALTIYAIAHGAFGIGAP